MANVFAKALGPNCRKIQTSFKESRLLSVRTIHTQGSGLYGVLGHGPDLKDSAEFRLVNPPLDEELVIAARQVSAGWGHSAAVTRDGELAIWGRPFDFDNLMKLNQINGFSGIVARMASSFTSKVGNAVDGLHTSPYFVEGLEDISSVHCSAGLTGMNINVKHLLILLLNTIFLYVISGTYKRRRYVLFRPE
jgi:alpha-tubulin suppressor-like RCC1 family protein